LYELAWWRHALAAQAGLTALGCLGAFVVLVTFDELNLALANAVAIVSTTSLTGTIAALLMVLFSPVRYWLNDDWALDIDPRRPADMKIHRPRDGKFFAVLFNRKRWGQPVIRQVRGADGAVGLVCPFVRWDSSRRTWLVAVKGNFRPCNDYEPPITEAFRASVSSSTPPVTTEGLPVQDLCKDDQPDSARIDGPTKTGVVDLTANPEFPLPGVMWITLPEYCRTTDMQGKAALLEAFGLGRIAWSLPKDAQQD
jgi:hypothetical protein